MLTTRIRRLLLALAGAALVVLTASGTADAGVACKSVEGSYDEHIAAGTVCDSPVGLCIAGDYKGDIKGAFTGSATALIPTGDTPVTTVTLFTSDSTITATVHGRRGTLIIKNAGGFTQHPDGSIIDLQTIVGGTGQLAGTSGSLRASGTFSFATGTGHSQWQGTVCLP